MDLYPGEHRRIDVITDPSNATVYNLSFTTEDSSISVDYNTGVVTALQEGTGTVQVLVTFHNEEGQSRELICIVNVKKEEEKPDVPASEIKPEVKQSFTQNDEQKVPAGISTCISLWLSSIIISVLGIIILNRRNKTGDV